IIFKSTKEKGGKTLVKRVYVEKKKTFDIEAKHLKEDICTNLRINITHLRVVNRYDIEGLSENEFSLAVQSVLSEPNVDNVYYNPDFGKWTFGIEYLPGQFD